MKIDVGNNIYIPVGHKTKYIDYRLDLLIDDRGEYLIKVTINRERDIIKNRFEILDI